MKKETKRKRKYTRHENVIDKKINIKLSIKNCLNYSIAITLLYSLLSWAICDSVFSTYGIDTFYAIKIALYGIPLVFSVAFLGYLILIVNFIDEK